ncbi:phage holin family protein [Desulfococcaceae bacterium HSG9]|nr:phage holin family protein [Desulfococcaceae bacterium HSG9]
MNFLWNILLLAAAVFIVANVMPGIKIKNLWTTLIVAAVYSLINFFVGWLLHFLALPLIIITFGLFNFVVNAAMLWLTDIIIDDFEVDGILNTLIAAFLITIINSILRWLLL